MKFTKLVPNIFYTDIQIGLQLFVDCLEFEIGYNGLDDAEPCCVVQKDELAVFLHQSREFAEKDRPEIRLQTPAITEVHAKIKSVRPEWLHPNLPEVKMRPWGALEFAIVDASGVCVIIQQWDR